MQIEITKEYLASQGLSETFPKRFWSKVDKDGPIPAHRPELGPCWIWTGCKIHHGYGSIYPGNSSLKMISAAKASWILSYGPIEHTMYCLHRCDNPTCVRPSHLWFGTQKENVADCIQKGRANRAYGENNGRAKLDDAKIMEIRASQGHFSKRYLAKKYQVTRTVIANVMLRKSWKHVK